MTCFVIEEYIEFSHLAFFRQATLTPRKLNTTLYWLNTSVFKQLCAFLGYAQALKIFFFLTV